MCLVSWAPNWNQKFFFSLKRCITITPFHNPKSWCGGVLSITDWEARNPVVQSIVSLTSSLVVKKLTVTISTISDSKVFLLKKMWVAFANAKATHIFCYFCWKNISIYATLNDQSFYNTLTNYTISFEQLGPSQTVLLILSTLWANSADDKLMTFSLLFLSYYNSIFIHISRNWLIEGILLHFNKVQDLVVQSVVTVTSSIRVISLTVLADSIHNILIFFAEKMWGAFALLTFFQQKISAYLHITQCKF